jgi:light-independent protochlorophyllide reductase subunit B
LSLQVEAKAPAVALEEPPAGIGPQWTPDGEAELSKIPFFVRGKVRRNTETFARERGLERIDAEALYDAKAHYSR